MMMMNDLTNTSITRQSHDVDKVLARVVQSLLKTLATGPQISRNPQPPSAGDRPSNLLAAQTNPIGGHCRGAPSKILLRNACEPTRSAERVFHPHYWIRVHRGAVYRVVTVLVARQLEAGRRGMRELIQVGGGSMRV